ncbi:glycosyltransferase family 39 protein [Candidatus Woesebacteria bacterium]|nr:glycosyltransferase family 39 protein [Candidatus Woesebacteria bacterium]
MNKLFELFKSKKYFGYIILSTILIGAFVVRLYKINNPIADWHSWRQADTASVTRTYVDQGLNIFYPRYHDISSIQTGYFNPNGYRFVEFPIYNVLHAIVSKNFPQLTLEVWGRLLSIISALVSTILIFLLGRKIGGTWVGLTSAFFFAFLPYNVYFTRVVLPEPFCVMFILASLLSFYNYYESENLVSLYLSGMFFALAMLIKPFIGVYIIPIIYLTYSKYGLEGLKKFKVLLPLLIFLDLALVPFFLWRFWINHYPEGIPAFEWAFNGDRIRFRPAFWRWIFGERLGYLILGTWGLVPFVLGLIRPIKKNYFIQFCLLAVFMYVTVVATASVRHDYYQILIIPVIALSLGSGFCYLWTNQEFNKFLSRFVAMFSVLIMILVSFNQVKEFYKINHPEIVQAGIALDKIAPKDALVIAPYNGDTAFLYQTKRWGWPVVETSIDETIKLGAKYYVSVNYADPDTIFVMNNFKVVEKTPTYVVADLTQRVSSRQVNIKK